MVNLRIDDRHDFDMVLDTGASCTTIDSNILYLNDCPFERKGFAKAETANGAIKVEMVEVGSVSSLGIQKEKFPIQVYDFLSHGILTSYDGTLGLDFFEGTKFCIDMNEHTITLTSSRILNSAI
jgi:hypothetical protein